MFINTLSILLKELRRLVLGLFRTQHAYNIIDDVLIRSCSSSSGWALWESFTSEFTVSDRSISVFVEFVENLFGLLVTDEESS